jgi:hypothetical protein
MNVIRGKGLELKPKPATAKAGTEQEFDFTNGFMDTIKEDVEWVQEKGEQLLEAFMLPPLQVIAAAINFLTLLVSSTHLFDLPFDSIDEIKQSKVLIETLSKKSDKVETASAAD